MKFRWVLTIIFKTFSTHSYSYSYGVFDLLKMKDMTQQFQLYSVWFIKLFMRHDKLDARDKKEKKYIISH